MRQHSPPNEMRADTRGSLESTHFPARRFLRISPLFAVAACGGGAAGPAAIDGGNAGTHTTANTDAASSDTGGGSPTGSARAVSVGWMLSGGCIVTVTAGIECWGFTNFSGPGIFTPSAKPTAVMGDFASGVIGVSIGHDTSCAVATDGRVLCVGANGSGELGLDSSASSSLPVPVMGITGATAVSIKGHFACALTGTGGVVCWGDNTYGQLGNGSTGPSSVPMPVTGLSSGATAVSVGVSAVACAVTGTGGVMCWGLGTDGQLGNGSTALSSVPVPVTGLSSGVTAVSVGEYSACALTEGGAVLCWGNNTFGKLGNNSQTDSLVPVQVTGLGSGVKAVSVGPVSACAITQDGGVMCWGSNSAGQLGNNSMMNSSVPVQVTGLAGATDISVGSFACAVTTGGAAWCWGGNALGDGSQKPSVVPVRVAGF